MTEQPVRRRGPGSRADAHHPTRHQLLAAALHIAEEDGLSGLSVTAVTRRAGVAKGTYYVHFSSRAEFLVAVHRQFHDELLDSVALAIGDTDPGELRLRTGGTAYLDGCLRSRGVKAMLREARGEPAIHQAIAERNDQATALARADFEVLGVAHPQHTARLFIALIAEVAMLELEKAEADPAARATLWRMAGIPQD